MNNWSIFMQNLLNKITKWSIYLLVFLTPLFWLPFSFEVFEFNKQYLIFFLVSLAFLAHLAKMILVEGQVRFKRTPLDLFVGGFLFLAILSAIFSTDKNLSLFGFYGRFSEGLIRLLTLGIFYFLITNNAGAAKEDKTNVNSILKVFLWSVFFVVLSAYFSIFGIWQKMNFLSPIMRQKIFNPVSGSLEGLAVFLSAAIIFLTGLILFSGLKSKDSKLASFGRWLLLTASLGLLLIIDYRSAWLIMLASLILFMGFAFWKRIFKENVNRLLLPIFLIIVAFFGFSGNIARIGIFNVSGLAKEQVLERGISWQVALGSSTDNVKSALLGSGIGTFSYDFSKEKPASFNQNRFWQIRFDRPSSHLAEILGTMGFLGIVGYLSLISAFLLLFYFLLSGKVQKSESFNPSQLSLAMMFLALTIAQFFYYQNSALALVFWQTLALAVVGWQKPIKEKVFNLKSFPELNLVFNVVLMVIGLGLLSSFYLAGRFYLADIAFLENKLEKAVKLNPYQAQYWTTLARDHLRKIQSELAKPADKQDQSVLQNSVALAIEAGKTAVAKGPSQVAGLETLAMIYRDIEFFASGANEWSKKYFEEAIALEPTNPVLRTEFAKMLAPRDKEKARAEILKAEELKPDYLDAVLQNVSLMEQEGNLSEATRKIENLTLTYPFNIGVLFQLGRLYFNTNRVDEAIVQFQNVLILFPNHSNALYSLGVAYEKKGMPGEAKKYFEKVLEMNPDNQEIEQKIKE